MSTTSFVIGTQQPQPQKQIPSPHPSFAKKKSDAEKSLIKAMHGDSPPHSAPPGQGWCVSVKDGWKLYSLTKAKTGHSKALKRLLNGSRRNIIPTDRQMNILITRRSKPILPLPILFL